MSYRVIAPLLVIKDQAGRNHHTYHGGVTHYLNDEQKAHFLGLGLVEEVVAEAPEAPAVESHSHHAKPAKVASKEAWVEHGAALGHDRGELEALSKQDILDLLG